MHAKSSKSSVYFNLIASLRSEELHFKCPTATCGYHIGQHRSRRPVGREGGKERGKAKGRGTAVGEPQGASGGKKVARNRDWGGELEGRKSLRHNVLHKSAGLFLV